MEDFMKQYNTKETRRNANTQRRQMKRAFVTGDIRLGKSLRGELRKLPRYDPKDPDFKFVIFDTGMILLLELLVKYAQQIKDQVEDFLEEELKLELSRSKTKSSTKTIYIFSRNSFVL